MELLTGKVALVSGVGRKKGIGAAICRELARNGADVFFTYWRDYDRTNYPESSEENPAEFAKELQQFGTRIRSAETDLSEPKNIEILFSTVVKDLGTPDILINNAAVSTRQAFEEITADILDQHYAINVRATTLLCQEFVKNWSKTEGGSILNLTSGQDLGVMTGELPYTITKAGVDMLTKQLAPELLRRGIVINALDPGPTDTGWMTEEKKEQIRKESKRGQVNTPEDTARLIISTLTDGKNTGRIIHADR